MKWRTSSAVRAAPGFIEPCIPVVARTAPKGPEWVYEIKQDGCRLMVRRQDDRVRIYSRRGADFTKRFPRVVEAVSKLKAKSVFLDGEGVICDAKGMAQFDLLHSRANDGDVTFCALDILEIDGEDVRPLPLGVRKTRLQKLTAKVKDGISYSEHLTGQGSDIFRHACKLGCEGIIAKRIDLGYESGRSRRWLKIKNPDSPAMRRTIDDTF